MDFNSLKTAFNQDSKVDADDKGLDWKAHFDTFIQYTQAKFLEQVLMKLEEIKQKIPTNLNNL